MTALATPNHKPATRSAWDEPNPYQTPSTLPVDARGFILRAPRDNPLASEIRGWSIAELAVKRLSLVAADSPTR
jgi:hypothetical protein